MFRAGSKRGIAARVGSWSARHKKSVLAGWLVFVIASVVIGGAVGTSKLTQADQYTGQSGERGEDARAALPQAGPGGGAHLEPDSQGLGSGVRRRDP